MSGSAERNNRELTYEQVRRLFTYEPDTGILRWNHRDDVSKSWNARFAGKEAGSLDTKGYRRVAVNGKFYLAHQIAWFYVKGYWADEIDHEDHDRSNNRLNNLRDATSQMNSKNRGLRSDSTSGFVGVSQIRKTGRWRAYFHAPGQKQILLGVFATKEEAVEARKMADNENDFHPNHGLSKVA